MTPENFCYWLQGFIEINGGCKEITPEQVKTINDHLQLVFVKLTPNNVSMQDYLEKVVLTKPATIDTSPKITWNTPICNNTRFC